MYVHCVWCVFTRALDDRVQMGQTEVCPSCSAGEWMAGCADGWMGERWINRGGCKDDGWMVT